MSFILKLLIAFITFIIINLLKIENNNNRETNSKIISYTLDKNPNDLKNFLPKLPKIFTKVGLQCDFPFVYKETEYKSTCATRKIDNKKICKVSLIKEKENSTDNQKRIKYFSSLLNSDKTLIKIHEDFYSECLSIDETEQILTQFLENGEKLDINRKLLTDLFSDIKREIKKNKESKSLTELFKLAENYCKSADFNFDCLYQNLIMPVSKTNSLQSLSQNIFDIIEKYKEKLKRFVENSQIANFRFKQFEFINEENLNFELQKINMSNITISNKQNHKENNFGSEEIISDEDNESNVENEIEKDAVYDSQNERANKIFFKQFIKILISVYHLCPEECKSTLDYLFVENFGNRSEKIKKEIIAYLFKLNDTDFNIEKDILVHSSLDEETGKNSVNYVVYNKKRIQLNNHLKIFLNYKNWSTRYLIAIFYRYILIEKNFFTEMIKGDLKEEEMKKILFGNYNLSYDSLDNKNELKIMRTVPLISPYHNFTNILKKKLYSLFGEWLIASNIIYKEYNHTKKILNDLDIKLTIFDDKLQEKINFFSSEMKAKIKQIKKIKDDAERNTKILSDFSKSDSSLNDYKLNSHFVDVQYISDLIYKHDFLSNDCHKFLHFHTYLSENAIGIPYVNYISVSSILPRFFVEFDKDIRSFNIYGILSFNKASSGSVKYLIRIDTNSDIEFYFDDKLENYLDEENKSGINKKTNRKFKYIIEVTGRKISKIKITGKFFEKAIQENKFLLFRIEKIATLNSEIQFNSTKSENNLENQVNSKCEEKVSEVDICFNPLDYKIECELSCKILSKNYLRGLKERNYIKESADKYHSDKKTLYKMKFFKLNIKFNKKKYGEDELELKRYKYLENDFISNCNNYCKAFKWQITVYKCLLRNIESYDFGTLLIKCSGLHDWEVVGRTTNPDTWFNFTNILSKDDILLGKRNYSEYRIKEEFKDLIKSSIYNPLSNKSFNLPFELEETSKIEYMFASGDIKYFVVLDIFQLFIKGAPYNSRSKFNHRLLSKKNKNLKPINDVSIFNLLYSTDFMSNEGIVIYDSKYNENSIILFSNNKNITISNNSKNILKENKGANIYIRRNGKYQCVSSELSNKLLLISNLASKEFYYEYVIAKESIYAFSDGSQDLIYKLPEPLSKNSFLIRTRSYQQKYSLTTNMPVKIYISLELTRNIEKNAQKVLEDGWMSLNGADNLIEIINTDLDEEVIFHNKYEDKNFSFNNMNNFTNSNKFTIFHKNFRAGSIDISFSFFDFDDLYSSRHLLLIQPIECLNNENTQNKSQGSNKFYGNQTEISNEFIMNFEEFLPSHIELLNRNDKLYNNNCDTNKADDKIIENFIKYAELMPNKCNDTLLENTITHDIDYNYTIMTSNYTIPLIRTNSYGCLVVLDKLGNLFFKDSDPYKLNSTWLKIKDNVKFFDMSENAILIIDTFNNLVIQSILNLNDYYYLKNDAWNYINYVPNKIFTKFSLSVYNCIWLLDNENNLYYGRVNQNNLTLAKSEENKFTQLKTIYQFDDTLYILTNKDEIYKKQNVYDIYNDECNEGKVSN